ncbi:MAG: cupin domain-containing protein [Janthinobacterium lividum]
MQLSLLALLTLAAPSLALPSDALPSAVYHAPPAARPGAGRTSLPLLKGRPLDLKELEITTSTLPAGQASRAQPGGSEELLIVQAGQLAATVHDSTTALGPGGVLLTMAGEQPVLRTTGAAPVQYWVLKFKAVDAPDAARGQAAGGPFGRDWPALQLIKTDKGETRPVFDRPSSMFPRFDVHATVLNPGRASHPPHTHRTEEIILMTQGRGQIQIGDQSYPAAAGDAILLRANVPHAFTNNSPAPVGYFAMQWHTKAEQSEPAAK